MARVNDRDENDLFYRFRELRLSGAHKEHMKAELCLRERDYIRLESRLKYHEKNLPMNSGPSPELLAEMEKFAECYNRAPYNPRGRGRDNKVIMEELGIDLRELKRLYSLCFNRRMLARRGEE